MNKARKLGALKIYLVAAVFVIPALSIVAGNILAAGRTPDFVFTVIISLMAALFSLIAIPTFLSGLRNFKAGLRRSYILLCIGIGIFGLAQFQIPAVNLTGWWVWLDSGLAGLVYLVSVVPMLLGMRMFAKLLNVKTKWSSIWLCIAVFVITSEALWYVPHVHQTDSALEFNIFISIVVWSMFAVLFCGMLALNIRKVIADAYKKSLWWLAVTFFVVAFGGLHFIAVYYLLDTGNWYFDYSLNILPFVAGGLLFIISGYKFNSVDMVLTEGAKPAGGHLQPTALDVITHVATLASNPGDIDAILDDMRVVTSHITAGQSLQDTDETKLYEVYKQLVVYLTRQDPLRQYTNESIQQNLAATFGEHIEFLEKQGV